MDNRSAPLKTIAFFNNKGGVGKTSMVFHLSWMLAELGFRTLAVDFDPQSNLTSAFLEEDELVRLWPDEVHSRTVLGAVQPLIDKLGDIEPITPLRVRADLSLLPGDLGLGLFEDRLSQAWNDCMAEGAERADGFRVMSAFHRIIANAANESDSDVVLIDVGPSIGALNRAALVSADFVVIPLGADLFSIQGLRNLGPTLRSWRDGWKRRISLGTVSNSTPSGSMKPLGYVLLNPSVRENRPVKSYQRWVDRIPEAFCRSVLGVPYSVSKPGVEDRYQLAMVKHFKSLMPMAQDARKPMFMLTPKDGAIGGHAAAVSDCRTQFAGLSRRILREIGLMP